MSKETSINEKLFNLQQEIGTISKDAKNPFYKSKYFDINSLIKQLQPLLLKNRLLLLQPIEEDMVVSKLICVDGSLLGLQSVDDDANIASSKTPTEEQPKGWLNSNTPEFSRALKYLKEGGTMEIIMSKYKVSKKVQDELTQL